MLPGVGSGQIHSPVSSVADAADYADGIARPQRSRWAVRRADVTQEDLDDSSNDADMDGSPHILSPPIRRISKPISYLSMKANCRRLQEKVMVLKKDLNDLKTNHTATSSQLKKSTTKCLVISTKLDEAAAFHKELGLLADQMDDRIDEKSKKLELPKPKLP
jgi:hypothetical protein